MQNVKNYVYDDIIILWLMIRNLHNIIVINP